jgi:predicted transcriptional regulator
LRDGGPVKRTQLATASNLSYDALVKYLDWMNHKGFVRVDDEGMVHLTSEGEEVYDRLVKWIMEFVGSLRFPRFGKP